MHPERFIRSSMQAKRILSPIHPKFRASVTARKRKTAVAFSKATGDCESAPHVFI